MKARQWMQVAAVASAVGFTGVAFGQVTNSPYNGHTGMGTDANTSPLGQTPESAGVGGNDQSMRLPNMDTWMNSYATSHNGRITREEFMDQMGHRWDMRDAQRRGYLTPDEARGIYAPDDQAARPARSGSEVAPGYMGPGSTRGK
jgi:hypothetical protein